MSLLKKARKKYHHEGLTGVLKRGVLKVLTNDTIRKISNKTIGQFKYEKLVTTIYLGYKPEIENPGTFNEKVLHRKFFTDKEIFTELEDKVKVRNYVEEKVGSEILPEAYFVTEKPEEIPFEELPQKFAVKANHGCGWNEIIENKEDADFQKIKQKAEKWLNQTYGKDGQYWYHDIEPKILVEEYLENSNGELPRDYKFYVFDGKVQYIHVDFNRGTKNQSRTIFDRNWSLQDFELLYPKGPEIEKPGNIDKMIQIAEKLGEDINFVRVDLYNIDEQEIKFGEITIGPGSGRSQIRPKTGDYKLGKHWKIDEE